LPESTAAASCWPFRTCGELLFGVKRKKEKKIPQGRDNGFSSVFYIAE
jgi:hypothetical protein